MCFAMKQFLKAQACVHNSILFTAKGGIAYRPVTYYYYYYYYYYYQ